MDPSWAGWLDEVSLQTAPQITNQPASVTAIVGGTAAFGVGVTGANPLAYQWQHEGTNLLAGTDSTLTIAAVQDGDAGTYRVVVTNAYGSASSAVASLTVNFATVDDSFNPGANSGVFSLAVQADGKMLVGGYFTTLDGQTRNYIGRLNGTDPATQSLACDGSTITWLRGGTSPEILRASCEATTNGLDWLPLGEATRIAGGWRLADLALPQFYSIRACGLVMGGRYNGSSWLVESGFTRPPVILSSGSGFGVQGGHFGLQVQGRPGQVVVIKRTSDRSTWLPLQTNTLGTAPLYFADPESAHFRGASIAPARSR